MELVEWAENINDYMNNFSPAWVEIRKSIKSLEIFNKWLLKQFEIPFHF